MNRTCITGDVYVPYYDPAVVYGDVALSGVPGVLLPAGPYYGVGGAIATGIAWGAGFAIGHEIWDNFDWRHGNINVDMECEHRPQRQSSTTSISRNGSTTPIIAAASTITTPR